LLLLLVCVPSVLLLWWLWPGGAAAAVVAVGQVAVAVLVLLLSWRQLVRDVKPGCHAHEAQGCDKPCCNLFEHWPHPIAHHRGDSQHKGGDKELWMVADPGQQQERQAE
jgi:hypothetical protein